MTYETFDPFAEAPNSTDDYATTLNKLGWENVLTLGDERGLLYVNAWQRQRSEGPTEYAVDVWDNEQGSPFVKVDTWPEVMDLLARWAPAVQAASLSYLVNELVSDGLSTYGTVETIAAKVAYGLTDALPAMRSAEKEAQRNRQRIAAERRAARAAGQNPGAGQ